MDSVDFTTRRGIALQPGMLQAAPPHPLTRTPPQPRAQATLREVYDALCLAVHGELSLRWLATQRRVANAHVKRVCYLSVEYLPGRSLLNALYSLEGDLVHEARAALKEMGYEAEDKPEQEAD